MLLSCLFEWHSRYARNYCNKFIGIIDINCTHGSIIQIKIVLGHPQIIRTHLKNALQL